MERLRVIGMIVLVGSILILAWPVQLIDDDIHTHRFCAYGQVYVEFQHGSSRWGTTFLDEYGHPISCNEDDVKTQTAHKEVI